jgi:hypothetical protein
MLENMLENMKQYLPQIGFLLILVVGYFVYTYYMKSKNIEDINNNIDNVIISKNDMKNEKKNLSVTINDDFIKSDGFAGKKKGYVFKKGDKGLGYYLDK